MACQPLEITLEISPERRFDLIDVAGRVRVEYGDISSEYRKSLYCSYHTTAGYLEQSLCARLQHRREYVDPFMRAFQKLFPPGANYLHDMMELRTELSEEQKKYEPKNADSHLTYISSGLKNCATYINQPGQPVYFIELDGTNGDARRQRRTSVLAYNREELVDAHQVAVPVSKHPVDSVNLMDPRIGFVEELNQALRRLGIRKGRVDISLRQTERHAGLTVNEYETLLMRHDLVEILHDPLRFMAMQGKHMLLDPRAIPSKTKNYAKYDLVHVFNELMDAFRASESLVEKLLAKFIAFPASRFLRMKRSVSMLVSDEGGGNGNSNGESDGRLVFGTYQSPILVQWQKAEAGQRLLDVRVTRFE